MKRPLIPILFLATLAISACVTAGDITPSRPEPPLENASAWQGVDCIAQYKKLFASSRAEAQKQYIECEAAQLPPLDPSKREHFGEQYSPRKYLECKLKMGDGNSDCDIYKLRRVENPEYWPYPDVPKAKWPEAPKESVYKPGMTSKQYFDALCKAEAGEFIYKTVENVEGIYQVRPRTRNEDQNDDLYAIEDPYVIDNKSPPWMTLGVQRRYQIFGRYQFLEVPIQDDQLKINAPNTVVRFFGSDDIDPANRLLREYSIQPKSQYGFTWRGIRRPHDREMGVAGSELIVLDLNTNEILALRRGFARRDYIPHTLPKKYWGAEKCPVLEPLSVFLMKVAKPNVTSTEIKGDSK